MFPAGTSRRVGGAGGGFAGAGGTVSKVAAAFAAKAGTADTRAGGRLARIALAGALAAVLAGASASAGCGRAGGGERGGFIRVEADGDTTTVESYTARADRLEGELRMGPDPENRARATYAIERDVEGAVSNAEVTVWRAGARRNDPPLHRWSVSFRGDTAYEVIRSAGLQEERATRVPPGTVPYFAPSAALLGLIVRAAEPAPELRAVPVYVLGAREPARSATVERAAEGEAAVGLDGVVIELRLDEAGRIVSGTAERPDYRLERVR